MCRTDHMISLIDVHSLIFILLFFPLSVLSVYGLPKSTKDLGPLAYHGRYLAIHVGLVGLSFGGVITTASISDPGALGPAFSVCLIPLLYGVIISLILGIFSTSYKPESSSGKLKYLFILTNMTGQLTYFLFFAPIDYLVSSLPVIATAAPMAFYLIFFKKINEDFKKAFPKTLLFIFTLVIVALTFGGNLSGGSLGFPFHQFFLGALYLVFINLVLVLPHYSSHNLVKPALIIMPISVVFSMLFFMMNSLH